VLRVEEVLELLHVSAAPEALALAHPSSPGTVSRAFYFTRPTTSFCLAIDVAMAANTEDSQPRSSLDFAESSVLEAVVPASTEVDIEDELNSWDGADEDGDGSILPFLSRRHVLLLGTSPVKH
jgi:hypothetical protein